MDSFFEDNWGFPDEKEDWKPPLEESTQAIGNSMEGLNLSLDGREDSEESTQGNEDLERLLEKCAQGNEDLERLLEKFVQERNELKRRLEESTLQDSEETVQMLESVFQKYETIIIECRKEKEDLERRLKESTQDSEKNKEALKDDLQLKKKEILELREEIDELKRKLENSELLIEKKREELRQADSAKQELESKLERARNEKEKIISDYRATEQKLKDRLDELMKHQCQIDCAKKAVLYILQQKGIDWCNDFVLLNAMSNAMRNEANIADTNLDLCTKTMELFIKAKLLTLIEYGKDVQIGNVQEILEKFRDEFPGVHGILAVSYPMPMSKIGHVLVVPPIPEVKLFSPKDEKYLTVDYYVGKDASKASLYQLNESYIQRSQHQLSSKDPSGRRHCSSQGGAPGSSDGAGSVL